MRYEEKQASKLEQHVRSKILIPGRGSRTWQKTDYLTKGHWLNKL